MSTPLWFVNPYRIGLLTVNSPVLVSKPTWTVCSKLEGFEISGFLPEEKNTSWNIYHNSYMQWTWWSHNIKMPSALLTLCDGESPMTCGFPSQRTSNANFSCFVCCWLRWAVEPTVELPVIPDTLTLMWHHCNNVFWIWTELFNECVLYAIKSLITLYQNDFSKLLKHQARS